MNSSDSGSASARNRSAGSWLADWADILEQDGLVKLASYRGKTGITTLLPRLASDNAGLVSISSDIKSAYMRFWRKVFERRTELHPGSGSRARNRTEAGKRDPHGGEQGKPSWLALPLNNLLSVIAG